MFAPGLASSSAVRIPMMPKGVEHKPTAFPSTAVLEVRIPMMPKGVEHINSDGQFLDSRSENSDDAERR